MRQVSNLEATDMFVANDTENAQTFGPFTDEDSAVAWVQAYGKAVEGRSGLDGWWITEVAAVDEHDREFTDFLGKIVFRMTFGPGSLESVQLIGYHQAETLMYRVIGSYRVYCGAGNEHQFTVESGLIDRHDWENYRDALPADSRVPFDNEAVTRAVIEEIVNEEWEDPCTSEFTDMEPLRIDPNVIRE